MDSLKILRTSIVIIALLVMVKANDDGKEGKSPENGEKPKFKEAGQKKKSEMINDNKKASDNGKKESEATVTKNNENDKQDKHPKSCKEENSECKQKHECCEGMACYLKADGSRKCEKTWETLHCIKEGWSCNGRENNCCRDMVCHTFNSPIDRMCKRVTIREDGSKGFLTHETKKYKKPCIKKNHVCSPGLNDNCCDGYNCYQSFNIIQFHCH